MLKEWNARSETTSWSARQIRWAMISRLNAGMSQTGTRIGGDSRTVGPGDIVIIPAGTPHKWEGSDEFTHYVVVRADPKGVAPLLELGKAQFVRPTP